MAAVKPTDRYSFAERANFLLTNRIPRRGLTRFMAWFGKLEQPLIHRLSMWLWQCFADDLRLHEARKQRFRSVHDCFIRELKDGARPIEPDPDLLTSPCDAVIGAFGEVRGATVIQAKGFPYRLDELLGASDSAAPYRDGRFLTLRLKSSMYHRFHAPCDARLTSIRYIAGDTWNVNPAALKRIERLYCRNTRAVLTLRPDRHGAPVTLVAVAAILVASLRFRGIELALPSDYAGPTHIPCDRALQKGDEIGYFEHGSTIVLLTTAEFQFRDELVTGDIVRMGRPLLQRVVDPVTTRPKK